jgi:hypothetical protein
MAETETPKPTENLPTSPEYIAQFNLKNLLRLPVEAAAKVLLLEMVRQGGRGPLAGGSYALFDLAKELDLHPAVAEASKRQLERLDACFRDVQTGEIRLIQNTEWLRVMERNDPDLRATLKKRDEEIAALEEKLASKPAEEKVHPATKKKVERLETENAELKAKVAELAQAIDKARAKGAKIDAPLTEAAVEPAPAAPSEPPAEPNGDLDKLKDALTG